MASQIINLGTIRFIWKGDWSNTTEYKLNDVVRYNNIVWIYTNEVPSSSAAITNADYWTRMVEGSEIPPTEGQAGKVLKTDGTLTFWSDSFDTFKIGADITEFVTAAGLTDVSLGIQGASSSFTQVALVNTGQGTSSSADYIAYASNGTNESGWIDMGITNQSFNDPTFSLTGPGDGYLFMSGAIAGVVAVSQFNVANGNLNLVTAAPHQMIQGVIFDLVLPANPSLEGRYVVADAPTETQITVPAPANTANIALTDVINSQINKFTGDGNLVLATDGTGLANNIVIAAGGLTADAAQIVITPNDGVTMDVDLHIAGSTDLTGTVYVGNGAKAFETSALLTNPGAVFHLNGSPYAQLAVHNSSSNSSTDIIAYANNGNDASGWIDMGITGSAFADSTFPITGPNDGYLFYEAPETTSGAGNLVIATGANGSENHIVFAAGGYSSGNTQMTIIPDDRVHIEIPTPSTSATTGALTVVGGVGISGDINLAGSMTVAGNVDIVGQITFGGSGTTVETSNLAVTDPMVFVGSGNPADVIDLALIGEYKVGATIKYSGVARDASDGVIKFFNGATTKPTSTVNFSEAGVEYSAIKVGAIDSSGLISTTANISTSATVVANSVTTASISTPSGALSVPSGISTVGLTATGGVSLSGTVDVQELRETVVNVTLSANSGTLDWSQGNIFYIATAPTAAMTFDVTNVPVDANKIMTINVMVTQGATGYIPTTFKINGVTQTIRWAESVTPTGTSSAGKIDMFSFAMHRTDASSWIIYSAVTTSF